MLKTSKKLPFSKILLIGSLVVGGTFVASSANARGYTVKWGTAGNNGNSTGYSNLGECNSKKNLKCVLVFRGSACGVNIYGSKLLYNTIRKYYRAKRPVHVWSRVTNRRVCAWNMR